MITRIVLIAAVLGIAVLAIGLVVTAPGELRDDQRPTREASVENGRRIFLIGGCASCHAASGAEGDARLVLEGGRRFATPFGVFVAPNVSPDRAAGIGDWSSDDFANAMLNGVSPEGRHYYPAFPYGSYARMKADDVYDLFAYVLTLPASARGNEPHELNFPFSIRRGVGLWKLLYLSPSPVVETPPELDAGRYLVEGPGHCGECHTPRDPFGGPNLGAWLRGAPSPEGRGSVPAIAGASADIAGWPESDVAEYLKSGFTPDYDTAGGSMVEVIENTSKLPQADRDAIAEYLRFLATETD